MSKMNGTIFTIGSGPGIGRAVTSLFALKGCYQNVALFARRSDQLAVEKSALEETVGTGLRVKIFTVDITDTDAFSKALGDAEVEFGKPDLVFFNAARVLPSQLLTHDVKEIEIDFKINVSALYNVAQRFIPHLNELAKSDTAIKSGLIVTSSLLPQYPVPQFFTLSLVKAAQRNFMQSLWMTYAPEGVKLGLINVGGQVSPEHQTLNPTNIASKAWEWFSQIEENPTFEVVI